MDPRRHRLTLAVLAMTATAVIVAAWALAPPGDPEGLPQPLVSVQPAPGAVAVSPAEVVVVLPVGYRLDLVVDGTPIPESEVGWVEATGTFRWQPAVGGTVEAWGPGDHVVEVAWERVSGGRPDPGSFTWSFRVT